MTVFIEKVYTSKELKHFDVERIKKCVYETGCTGCAEPRHIIYKINERYHSNMARYRCPAEQTSSGQDMSYWTNQRKSAFEDYKREALREIIPQWMRIISNCKKLLLTEQIDMFEEFKRGYPHLSAYFDCKDFTWDIIGDSHDTNITTFIDCVITCILSKETEDKQIEKIRKQQELRKKQEEQRKLLLYKKEFECAKLFDEIDKNKLKSPELYVEYKKITEIKYKGALYNTEFINYFTEDKKKYIRGLIELLTNLKPVSNEVKPMPTMDDVETIYRKGAAYYFGRGVAQDYVEAARLYRLAAEQGHAGARCDLGLMFDCGLGVKQDKAEAVRLYRLAAEQGHAFAQFSLGRMFDEGRCVEQDKVEAARLYRLAAAQGNKQAQSRIALYDYWVSIVPRPVITPPVETAASVSPDCSIPPPPPYNQLDSSVIFDSNNDENLIIRVGECNADSSFIFDSKNDENIVIRVGECNAINIVVPQHPEGLGNAPPEPPAKKKRGRPSYKSLLLNLDKNTLRPKSVAGK